MVARSECKIGLILLVLGAALTCIDAGTKRKTCLLNEVRCPSGIGECIINTKICNGVKDCSDGSDERASLCASYDCTNRNYRLGEEVPYFMTKRCPSKKMCTRDPVYEYNPEEEDLLTYFTCNGGPARCADKSDQDPKYCKGIDCKAVPFGGDAVTCPSGNYCLYPPDSTSGDNAHDFLCDGIKDCPDGSDEWPSFCKTNGCSFYASSDLQCPDGKCLRSEAICNGVKDCSNGEDEDPTFCAAYSCGPKCPDGRTCLPYTKWCDGKKDCSDGSDEQSSVCLARTCESGQFRCKNGQCVPEWVRCDGVKDCKDGSDEDKNVCMTLPCFKCPNGKECLYSEYFLCNGKRECKDGSDESSSFCNKFKCPPGRIKCGGKLCVNGAICDGRVDCDDGSDEAPSLCSKYKCPKGSAKCPGFPNQCLDQNLLCDGRRDCVDGSDENPVFCKTYKCPQYLWTNCNGVCKQEC